MFCFVFKDWLKFMIYFVRYLSDNSHEFGFIGSRIIQKDVFLLNHLFAVIFFLSLLMRLFNSSWQPFPLLSVRLAKYLSYHWIPLKSTEFLRTLSQSSCTASPTEFFIPHTTGIFCEIQLISLFWVTASVCLVKDWYIWMLRKNLGLATFSCAGWSVLPFYCCLAEQLKICTNLRGETAGWLVEWVVQWPFAVGVIVGIETRQGRINRSCRKCSDQFIPNYSGSLHSPVICNCCSKGQMEGAQSAP